MRRYTAEDKAGPALKLMLFDGHTFSEATAKSADSYLWLYLAAKARRGDAEAAALLTGMETEIIDTAGRRYWPPENSLDAPPTAG